MNEQQQLIKDTVNRLLSDLCTPQVIDGVEAGEWPAELWQSLSETGLTLAGIDESAGGAGGDIEDSMLIIREAASHAAPVPLADHFIAALLLQKHGGGAGTDPMTVAIGDFEISADRKISGAASAVPFARWCREIIVPARDGVSLKLCRLPVGQIQLTEHSNMAGEPRDDVSVDLQLDDSDVFAAGDDLIEQVKLLGAATRAVMMSGALESVLEMSVQYSLERNQFGRPIAKFQAIQQQLALLAGEIAASTMASHSVSSAVAELNEIDIAIGKCRIGEAVSSGTDIAHQVHGAMGYTMEHTLNHRTRRLWCWREEYGNEREWQLVVGRSMLSGGADALWGNVTARN